MRIQINGILKILEMFQMTKTQLAREVSVKRRVQRQGGCEEGDNIQFVLLVNCSDVLFDSYFSVGQLCILCDSHSVVQL